MSDDRRDTEDRPPSRAQRVRGVLGTAISLILPALLLATVAYFQVAQPPAVAVASDSMAPTLERGDLILVDAVDPDRVQVGDIVVVDVPGEIQDRYGYPPSIVHRVVEKDRSPGGMVTFRTQGDNTNEDPFTTFPGDVAGQVGKTYEGLGFPILFLQSTQGAVFLVSLVAIHLAYKAAPHVGDRARSLKRSAAETLTAPVVDRLDAWEDRQEQSLETVHTSMDQFSEAMQEYATHLQSHTAAVQALAAAAEELRDAARQDPAGADAADDRGDEGGSEEG